MKKSPVTKRSIVIAGRKTSISLENAFWVELKRIAAERKATLSELVGDLDDVRLEEGHANLSSAVRLFILDEVKAMAALRSAA